MYAQIVHQKMDKLSKKMDNFLILNNQNRFLH